MMNMATSKKQIKLETVEPIGKRVLIRKDESRQQTRGGIVLPDDAEIPTITGRVVDDPEPKLALGFVQLTATSSL